MTPLLDPVFLLLNGCLFQKNLYQLILGKTRTHFINLIYFTHIYKYFSVEIDAKIASGYFTSGSVMTEQELSQVKGRDWEDVEH